MGNSHDDQSVIDAPRAAWQAGASGGLAVPRTLLRPPSIASRHRFLDLLASPWGRVLVECQNAVNAGTVLFWLKRNVRAVHLPVTTGAVSSPMGLGSDSLPVAVEIAGQPTYLADSMQFMLEYGCRMSDNGCYYVMPSFRGEQADATHLSQFFHSEAELPGGLENLMVIIEDYVRALCQSVLEYCADAVREVTGDLTHVEKIAGADAPFQRISLDEAVLVLGSDPAFVRMDAGGWRCITRAGEHELMRLRGEFVWLTHHDHMSVPFYQAFRDCERLAANADLLFGPGEVVGAGERHQSADDVRRALQLHGVPEEPYAWYVAMREASQKQTSGFGLGVERFLMWVLQHSDIRDLQLLLRDNGVAYTP